jgi:Sugar-transfer associated ATP-grasp
MRDWISTRFKNYSDLLATYRRAARRFDVSILTILKRIVAVYWRYRLGPHEVLNSDLIDPGKPLNADVYLFGRQRLTRHQRRFNPEEWICLVEDKVVFDAYCKANKIPVPQLYAVFDAGSGWARPGKLITERDEWEAFFEKELPHEFIVKPALGVFGQGVDLYRRNGQTFEDWSGKTFSAASLYEHLRAVPRYKRLVFQERVFNDPDIQSMTGTRSLQTARIVSWVTKEGEVELYHAHLKLIMKNNLRDNFSVGRSGNMMVDIDPATGELAAPTAAADDRIGFIAAPVHPVTHGTIAGTLLPHWPSTRQLVERAARLFMPLRTIGWDVAITADGPVIIEGNAWWGPSTPRLSERRQSDFAQFVRRFTKEP